MINKIYKNTITWIVYIILTLLVTKFWSYGATKVATRIYYGKQNTWERIYIITDLERHNPYINSLINIVYQTINKPTAISKVNSAECLINKCSPHLIISDKIDFIRTTSVDYPIYPFSFTTISYVDTINTYKSEDNTIIKIKVWDKYIYIANAKKNDKHFASILIKTIVSQEFAKRITLVEERDVETKKIQEQANKKIRQMQERG